MGDLESNMLAALPGNEIVEVNVQAFFKTEIKEELDSNIENMISDSNLYQENEKEKAFLYQNVSVKEEPNCLTSDDCQEMGPFAVCEVDFKEESLSYLEDEFNENTNMIGVAYDTGVIDSNMKHKAQNSDVKIKSLFQENIPSCSYKQKKVADLGKKGCKQSGIMCKAKKKYKKNILKAFCSEIDSAIKGKTKMTCDICNKQFIHLHHLKCHINDVHNKIRKHACQECSKTFSKSSNLKYHVKTVHRKIRDFACGECGNTFFNLSHMNIHVNTVHRGIKNYSCKYCDKTFSQSCNLKKHTYVHERNEDFPCEICSKVFAKSTSLEHHINSFHKGIKDFPCNSCEKRFSCLTELRKHFSAVHAGIRDYVCEFCGKAFSQDSRLQNHVNSVHKKRKNFECTLCQKLFSATGNLKNHIKVAHMGIKYECQKCDRKYSSLYNLKKHVSSAHTKSVE